MINKVNEENYAIDSKHEALDENTNDLIDFFSEIYKKNSTDIKKNLQHYISSTVGNIRRWRFLDQNKGKFESLFAQRKTIEESMVFKKWMTIEEFTWKITETTLSAIKEAFN